MKTRVLRDIEVSEIGMGCMAFSHGYGQIPSEQYSIEAIRSGYERSCTFFDTAEVYSPDLSSIGHNELIVSKALKDVRDQVVVATKLFLNAGLVGNVYKTIRSHLEASMKRLHYRSGRSLLFTQDGQRACREGRRCHGQTDRRGFDSGLGSFTGGCDRAGAEDDAPCRHTEHLLHGGAGFGG